MNARDSAAKLLRDAEGLVREAERRRADADRLGRTIEVPPEAVLMLGLALGHALLALDDRLARLDDTASAIHRDIR